jgi:type III secretion protein J
MPPLPVAMRRPRPSIGPGRAGLLLICLVLAACSEESLFAGLDPTEATEIVALLQARGIEAARVTNKDGTVDLAVPSERLAESVAALKQAGYPRHQYKSIQDMFPADGMLTTPFEQRARMTFALNEEIANTLSRLNGVTEARVHVVPAEEDLRGIVRRKPVATAMIRYRSDVDPTNLEVNVRTVLSRAVAGLEYSDVSIVMERDPLQPAEPVVDGRSLQLDAADAPEDGWVRTATAIALLMAGLVALAFPHLRRRLS